MKRRFALLTIFTILVLGSPLAGVYLGGHTGEVFTSFPPLTEPVDHEPFSWPVFLFYTASALVLLVFIVSAASRPGKRGRTVRSAGHPFPWWGRLGLVFLLLFWFLAWSRLSWFSPLQRHTFTPLWLSWIVVVNALCEQRTGSCPMRSRPLFFFFLFPASAVFWWYFEYLNQFVDNWYYTGVDYSPLRYAVHASISFSTVLPAVYSTRAWISSHAWFRSRFHGLPSWSPRRPRRFCSVTLVLACLGLAGVGLRPDLLFPLLWLAPLVILCCLQSLFRVRTVFSAPAEGDWRPALSAAFAALFCGFLWEMWNYYSLARWSYRIPYVDRFSLFEMPLLGYLGYLPFGLECLAVIELIKGFTDRDERQRIGSTRL